MITPKRQCAGQWKAPYIDEHTFFSLYTYTHTYSLTALGVEGIRTHNSLPAFAGEGMA